MAKKEKAEYGEQMMLLDIHTPEAKAFNKQLKVYEEIKKQRLALLREEVKLKNELLPLTHALELTPDGEGVITFEVGDVEVIVIPSRETIKVRTKKKKKKKVEVKEE